MIGKRGVWDQPQVGRVAGYSLLQASALYPFVMLYGIYVLYVHPLLLVGLLWCLHVCGVLIGTRRAQTGKGQIATVILLCLTPVVSLGWFGFHVTAALSTAIMLAAGFIGLIAGRKQLWRYVGLRLPLIGMAASLVLYISAGKLEVVMSYRATLYGMSIITLFALLLRLNSDKVREMSQQTERQMLDRILTANRRLMWIVIILIAALSGWNGFRLLVSYLRELIQSIGGHQEPPPPPEIDPLMQPQPEFGPQGEKITQWPLWLDIIGHVLLGIIGLVIVILVLIFLYKLFRRWLPDKIKEWIEAIVRRIGLLRSIVKVNPDQADYVDEVEKTERILSISRRFRRRRKEPEEMGSEPRRAYQNLIRTAIRRGFAFRSSQTPAENAAQLAAGEGYTELSPDAVEELVERYNHIRYGGTNKHE